MKVRCPKCHKDSDVEWRRINGKTVIVCPECGFWDSGKIPADFLRRWVINPCKTCMHYKWVEDLWRVPEKRKCELDSQLSEVDRKSVTFGKCRLYEEVRQ